MQHIIMVNPVSGLKKGNKHAIIVQKLLKKYNIDSEIFTSNYSGHLKEYAHQMSHREQTRFYSIGGDGTLNEIASGIIGTNSEIVVLPCGTGNDFARFFNEYKSLRKIILTSLNARATKIDIIKLNNDRYCVNILNAGFDALIAFNMNKFRWVPFVSGTTKYNLAIVYTLLFNTNYNFKIRTNEGVEKDKYTLIAISNARFYGGGVIPNKNAFPDDGLLSICTVKKTKLLEKIVLLPKYKKSKHENLPQVHINDEIQYVSIVSNKKFPLSIDGEIIYTNKFKASIIPGAVNIVTIKKSK